MKSIVEQINQTTTHDTLLRDVRAALTHAEETLTLLPSLWSWRDRARRAHHAGNRLHLLGLRLETRRAGADVQAALIVLACLFRCLGHAETAGGVQAAEDLGGGLVTLRSRLRDECAAALNVAGDAAAAGTGGGL